MAVEIVAAADNSNKNKDEGESLRTGYNGLELANKPGAPNVGAWLIIIYSHLMISRSAISSNNRAVSVPAL